jgi:DNA invertase Pin-like site-specific DNA recombinase
MASKTTAYSYIRFSHPDQAKGDSLRRQTEAAADWCKRNKVKLDTSLTLCDEGASAFTGEHRTNPDRHALAAFLELIHQKGVPRGSFLLIENLDRLSREEEVPACNLLTSILMAGVRVVQLSPYEMILTEKSNGMELMRAVMELSRGHGESAVKSERVGAAWAEKRRRARAGEPQKATKRMGEGCKVLTRRLPAWVELRGGDPALIPERAVLVKKMFALAAAGYGYIAIIRKLAEEGDEPFGKRWTQSFVRAVLNDRRALGEFQPCGKGREPEGGPIKGYFPAVVSENDFWAAQAARDDRPVRRRVGRHIDLFAGLLKDGRDGESYIAATRLTRCGGERPPQRVLIRAKSQDADGGTWSFPLPTFERAVLSSLGEVDLDELLGPAAPDLRPALQAELEDVRARKARIVEAIEDGTIDRADAKSRMDGLKDRESELSGQLAEAGAQVARPLAGVWREAQTLAEAKDGTLAGLLSNDETREDRRLRLRAALRRIVDSIYLLVTNRGRERMAAAQIWFKGEVKTAYRMVYVLYTPQKANGSGAAPGRWWAWSGEVGGDDAAHALPFLDLRRKDHVRRTLRNLADFRAVDLDGSPLDPKHLPSGWTTGVVGAKGGGE